MAKYFDEAILRVRKTICLFSSCRSSFTPVAAVSSRQRGYTTTGTCTTTFINKPRRRLRRFLFNRRPGNLCRWLQSSGVNEQGNYSYDSFFFHFFFFRFFPDEHIILSIVAIKFAWFGILEAYTFFRSVRTIIVNYVSTSASLRDVNNSTLHLILRIAEISFSNFALQEKFDQLINDGIVWCVFKKKFLFLKNHFSRSMSKTRHRLVFSKSLAFATLAEKIF